MSDFKDAIADDILETFLNLDEFAETHNINGNEMTAMIDDNVLSGEVSVRFGGGSDKAEGLYNGGIRIYVNKTDMPGKPKKGSSLILDDRRYTVEAVSEESGIFVITINRIGGR